MVRKIYNYGDISRVYGDSFYVTDIAKFRSNLVRFTQAFKDIYKNTIVAYSYKTNYLPDLCREVDRLGGYAEVVSGLELELALKLGVEPTKIFFNGPAKSMEASARLIAAGGVVNIDSLDELKALTEGSRHSSERTALLGLRINFNINDGLVSRFGFDAEGNELMQALRIFEAQRDRLKLVSIHCHFASRSINAWKSKVSGLIDFLENRLPEWSQNTLRFISVGGGFYGDLSQNIADQLGEINVPSYSEYANIVAKPLVRCFSALDIRPTLVVEPGTALVANVMAFASTVVSIKTIRGKSFATLSGSSSNIFGAPKYRLNPDIEVVKTSALDNGKYYESLEMVGYTCVESDVLYKGYSGQLAVGDLVIFKDVGSYSIVMKPPFIKENVPILLFDKENDMSVVEIKRRETLSDLFGTYHLLGT